MDVQSGRPFFVQVANFQSTPIVLHKHMYVAFATLDPVIFGEGECTTSDVLAVEQDDEVDTPDSNKD